MFGAGRHVSKLPKADIQAGLDWPFLHSQPSRRARNLVVRTLVRLTTSCKPEGIVRMFTKRDLLRSAAMTALAVTTAKSTPVIAQNKAEWPNLLEAKDIAEEGFIYGLPLVMIYAVMQEFAVDK